MNKEREQSAASPDAPGVTCQKCQTRLEVFETSSGGRTIAVAASHNSIEPKALERFVPPGAGPTFPCPACGSIVDPGARAIFRVDRRRMRK
jgi:ssDNA-binding Zn-finger/Zn-ribbon topoisomerase 1